MRHPSQRGRNKGEGRLQFVINEKEKEGRGGGSLRGGGELLETRSKNNGKGKKGGLDKRVCNVKRGL